MTPTPNDAPAAGAVDLTYAQVQHFYAYQMQQLDSGEAERWADTFTPDAVFDVPTQPGPLRGRSALIAAARRAAGAHAAAAERHRHFVGMLQVTERGGGLLQVRAYTVVYATVVGGLSRVHAVCVCQDVVERGAGGLLVRSRTVTRDDLP